MSDMRQLSHEERQTFLNNMKNFERWSMSTNPQTDQNISGNARVQSAKTAFEKQYDIMFPHLNPKK